jgi:2-methylcitrate dehydratase PrpD
MTVAGKLANYATALTFEDLPPEVMHQTKRILIDVLGCCIGAFEADASKILRGLVEQLGGPGESTVSMQRL